MTVVEIQKSDLLKLVGKEMTDEELVETLFLLKSEAEIAIDSVTCEINPDRPDMFSVEGIARAMKSFLNIEPGMKKYSVTASKLKMENESVKSRPVIACAIVEDVSMTDELVKSLMQMQEKLHASIGRDRRKVAVGVHDLEKIEGNLVYRDAEPEKAIFIPLGMSDEMSLAKILDQHPKGKSYAHLLKGYDKYPVIFDDIGVISFPPIINSERTKVTENTTNLFIDVTGTDERAVNHVLKIITCNIAERGGKIKSVKLGKASTPDLEPEQYTMQVSDVEEVLGLGLSENEIQSCLERMGYTVVKMKGGKMNIMAPPYRTDLMHKIDIVEDAAIGYGYNNITPLLPKIPTVGKVSGMELYSDKARDIMIGLGFQEFMGFILTSSGNNFDRMLVEKTEHIEIANPTSLEYNICRTWLLPGIMKVLMVNQHKDYPQKIFEIGDVILPDDAAETKTSQKRKICGVMTYDYANLTEIKSIIETLLGNLNIKFMIRSAVHPSFINTRVGEIFVNDKSIGFFGEIHPKVISAYKLEKPVVVFEIELNKPAD